MNEMRQVLAGHMYVCIQPVVTTPAIVVNVMLRSSTTTLRCKITVPELMSIIMVSGSVLQGVVWFLDPTWTAPLIGTAYTQSLQPLLKFGEQQ